MTRFDRVLVCVGQVPRDTQMLDYVASLSRLVGVQEIHLLHVEPSEPVPVDDMLLMVPEPPGDEQIVETMRAAAQERLGSQGGMVRMCEKRRGSVLLEILRYAMEKEVDLVVVGRGGEASEGDDALLASRIARKATCSVLVLPAGCAPRIGRILVPVRDSECSANALETACRIGGAAGAPVLALNVFHVNAGYHNVGLTLEEFTANLRRWAERECENLLNRVDRHGAAAASRCVPDLYARPVPIILEQAAAENADMVVIGARGRTGAAGVLLGKVTEQLIRRSRVPVLAVKKKGECLGVLQALLSLAG